MSNELRKLLSGDDDIVPALPRNIRVSAPTGSVFLIATVHHSFFTPIKYHFSNIIIGGCWC